MNISINTVFRKDRLNSQNAAPVHLRLTQTRKNKFISTGVTRSIDDWDFENQRIKAKTPELQALQLRIDTKIDELRRKIKRLEAFGGRGYARQSFGNKRAENQLHGRRISETDHRTVGNTRQIRLGIQTPLVVIPSVAISVTEYPI